ncbi:GHMP family kinase ATP-binding protein [Candidatus Pelagibacter sp. HIMB1746]|uniref:GHMP family kinase ATP-binding protein n=1 Tax=Candidatus Pelagibacter sp. HIMB1746 TaxID=3413370 RepID=UPI003F8369E8
MFLSRSPLRISLAGGGTDLPSYYNLKGGLVISAAINKYIYVTVNKTWKKNFLLKYSEIEKKKTIGLIKHNAIRETLNFFKIPDYLEISSISDVPAGTGLGSSGTFLVGLINVVNSFYNKNLSRYELAENACKIEMDILKEPSGKQDPFISSYGGLKIIKISKNGKTKIEELKISQDFSEELDDSFLTYFTGYTRQSKKILGEQEKKTKKKNKELIQSLDFVKDIAKETISIFKRGSVQDYANLMNEHWNYKMKRSKNMSSNSINSLIEYGLKNGALGAKLIGAGGGGFVLFITKDKLRLRSKMKNLKLQELKYNFDYDGSVILGRN